MAAHGIAFGGGPVQAPLAWDHWYLRVFRKCPLQVRGSLVGVLGIFLIVAGRALLRRREWARVGLFWAAWLVLAVFAPYYLVSTFAFFVTWQAWGAPLWFRLLAIPAAVNGMIFMLGPPAYAIFVLRRKEVLQAREEPEAVGPAGPPGRAPLYEGPPPPTATVIGWLAMVIGAGLTVCGLVLAITVVLVRLPARGNPDRLFLAVVEGAGAAILLATGVAAMTAGRGLLALRDWARRLTVGLCWAWVVCVPGFAVAAVASPQMPRLPLLFWLGAMALAMAPPALAIGLLKTEEVRAATGLGSAG